MAHNIPSLLSDDEIRLENQVDIESEVADLRGELSRSLPGASVNYLWQSDDGSGNWSPDPQDSAGQSDYSNLTVLTDGHRYRLAIIVSVPNATTSIHSLPSETVSTSADDDDIDFDALASPIAAIPISVSTRLTRNSQVEQATRVVHWQVVDKNGNEQVYADGESYTPTDSDVGFNLKVTVSYYDINGDMLIQDSRLSQEIGPALESDALTQLAVTLDLHRELVPQAIWVDDEVSFTEAAHSAIQTAINNNSGLTVDYRWQRGEVGNWTELGNTTRVHIAESSGQRLRLDLILKDTIENEEISFSSLPSSIVQAKPSIASMDLYLSFSRDTKLLSLTSVSQDELALFAAKHDLINPTYQWLRISPSGTFDRDALEVGMEPSGYTLMDPGDVGSRHGLHITLEVRNTAEIISLYSIITQRGW